MRQARGCLVACLVLLPGIVVAGGPILVDTEAGKTGKAVVWKNPQAITYNPETGGGLSNGVDNMAARQLVSDLFDIWEVVTLQGQTVVSFTVSEGSGLGDVSSSNIKDHFSYPIPGTSPSDQSCPGSKDPNFVCGSAGTSAHPTPILFDDDGKITDAINGSGSKKEILGFAGPRLTERDSSGDLKVIEGQAVLNGLFINGSSSSSDPADVSLNDFKGAIFHELGHLLGLDHAQVNLASYTAVKGGNSSEAQYIETMFPIFIENAEFITPHKDDIVALATLYPSSYFSSSFCTLKGEIMKADGTAFQGANVVARNVTSSKVDAVAFVSGALYTKGSVNSDYYLRGLIPGESYTLDVEPIDTAFRGGSSLEPIPDPRDYQFTKKTGIGPFSCSSAGTTIGIGTNVTTDFKAASGGSDSSSGTSDSSSGGCTLLPRL